MLRTKKLKIMNDSIHRTLSNKTRELESSMNNGTITWFNMPNKIETIPAIAWYKANRIQITEDDRNVLPNRLLICNIKRTELAQFN